MMQSLTTPSEIISLIWTQLTHEKGNVSARTTRLPAVTRSGRTSHQDIKFSTAVCYGLSVKCTVLWTFCLSALRLHELSILLMEVGLSMPNTFIVQVDISVLQFCLVSGLPSLSMRDFVGSNFCIYL